MLTLAERRRHAFLYILMGRLVQKGHIDVDLLHQITDTYQTRLGNLFLQLGMPRVDFGARRKGKMVLFDDVDELVIRAVADGKLGLNARGSTLHRVQADFFALAYDEDLLTKRELEVAHVALSLTVRRSVVAAS